MLPVAQTLHGYDQGHRLLAHSGDADENELAQLDRLSDLSGYVPLGTTFDHYYTGFPCGRFYAFACTWPDIGAVRAGTVLTHTLLLPSEHLAFIHDLWALQLHRRPESAKDRKPYSSSVSIDVVATRQPAPSPYPDRAADVIALWFGQDDRPALWTEEGGAEDVVRYLWSLLWGIARQNFSFCTFALQVRYLRREPFGFLVLPPSAMGSFHDRARSSAWWQDGQLSNSILRERLEQPWIRDVVHRGPEATHAMIRYCADFNLPPLDAVVYPVFFRFHELEAPAKKRLTAARSRADLLAKLWPDLQPDHPVVHESLRLVLLHQGDAPLTPKPFWDLIDLAKRPAFFPLLDSNPDFLHHAQTVYAHEMQRRLLEAENIDDLGRTLQAMQHGPLRETLLQSIGTTLANMSDEALQLQKSCTALLSSVEAQAPDLVVAILSSLPSTRRVRIAVRALEAVIADKQMVLADYVLSAALKLDEIVLVIDVWWTLKQPERALDEATRMVLAKDELRPELLNRILDRLDAEKRLAWAGNIDHEKLGPWAAQRGAIAANELKLSLPALLERCSGQPNAQRILLAYLDGNSLANIEDDDLFHLVIADVLRAFQDAPASKRLADSLAPRIVRRLARGWSVQDALPWLSLTAVQEALQRSSDWSLFSGYQSARSWDYDCLPNLAHALAIAVRTQMPASLNWIVNVLGKPLHDAPSTSFSRSIDDLLVLVDTPTHLEGWAMLAARILLAVRKNRSKHAFLLVERIFPVLYPALAQNQLDAATKQQLHSIVWRDWDTAKNWRHWLLDAWLGERWPGASFLRALGDDVALFQRIAYRAWHKEKAKDFVRSLSGAWGNDETLAAKWKGPVFRFLNNPDAKSDYE